MLGAGLAAAIAVATLVVATPLTSGAAPTVPPPETPNTREAANAQLESATGNVVQIKAHDKTKLTRFVGTTKAHPIPRAKGVSASASDATKARGFLATYGATFGVDDQAKELQVAKGGKGTSVPFQQVHDGVPVMGGEIQVNLTDDGGVLSANGEISPNLDVSTEPAVTSGTAAASVHTMASKYYGSPGTFEKDPELWIYDPQLLGGPAVGPARLVWRVTVSADDPKPFNNLVLIDAQTGGLALRINQLESIKTRQVCNRNNVVGGAEACTGSYARSEGQAATGVVDVDRAYDYAGDTYDFYFSKFGRDSLDGAGLVLKSTVKYCPDASNCPYQNAYWNGAQMVYGDTFASADDVVGHELSHGVTDFESSLFYYYQSGAINESMSDVFGELIDQGNGAGTDTPAVKWQMGEDLPASIGVIRNMADPTIYGDPDRVGSANYYNGSADSGGVHTNSGINNKAAFLISDGGTFNGQTITGLGADKTARIYYKVNTDYLTSASDYVDLADLLPQACQALVGTNSITAGDCTQVTKAVTATEMAVEPAGAPTINAPVCAAGQVATNLFNDDLENTASGNWTKTLQAGSQSWAYPQNPNIFSGFDATYATSGVTNFFGGNRSTASNQSMERTANVTPPAGKTTYLRFRHAFGLETGWDGGRVEYQVDNSGTWLDAGALFTEGGYNGNVNSMGGNGFTGYSNGYWASRINLTSFIGHPVKFRFRLQSDTSTNVLGWFIDDVRVYTCAAPANTAPDAPTGVTATAGNAQATVSWTPPANNGGSAITGYTVTPYIGAVAQTEVPFDDSATTRDITGLTNGTTYTFKVTASNLIGESAKSSASNAVTPTAPATAPGAPTIGTATAGDGQATLTWTAPASNGGSAITGYTVTPYIGAAAQTPQVFGDTLTTHIITGLTNGTAYTFKVAATNSVGTGSNSADSNVVTPAAVPGAPTIGTATAGNAKATLTWTAPASNGGSPITGYTVTPYIGAAAQTPQVFGDTLTTHDVTGLTNGTAYTFKVAATNAAGTGAQSAASNAVTPSAATAPGAPTIGNALPGNGSVALTWLAPGSNGGSAITSYVITPYIGAAAQAPIDTGSTSTSKTVTGLTNGTTYTFKVAAKNAVGTGADSAASGTVTAGAPASPGFPAAAPGDLQAKVAYTTPANNGSAITGYVITPYIGAAAQAPQTFNTTATSNFVTGLTNGTTYTFKIAAINANGTGPQATTNSVIVGTPTGPGFPNANPGQTSARITWLVSAPNGAPLQGYKITPYIGAVAQPTQTFNSTANVQIITGLTTGTNYSFKVAGFNSIGVGPEAQTVVITVGSPGAIGFQSASPGNGGATVQYLLPAANGSAITSYTVWPVQGSTVLAPQVFNTPSATSLAVTGLTNGTTYTFRVSATNAVGTSPFTVTNAITAGTPNGPGFPSAQPGNGTAKVAWLAPVNNGSAITSYTITPYIGSVAQAPQTFNTSATSDIVTGLTNGTTYTFKIYATNGVGAGLSQATSLSIKVGTPTTPNFPSAKPGNGTAVVSWGTPTANASAITGYVVTPVKGTTVLAPQTFNSTATTQTITGLTNGQTYTFRVSAINAIGTGPYSVTSALKVGTPSAPAKPTVAAGVGSVTVTWVAPADNGSAITGYIVTPIKAGVAQAPQAFDASTTSRIISGLTAGSSYTFTVVAVNALGNSAASPASNAAVPT